MFGWMFLDCCCFDFDGGSKTFVLYSCSSRRTICFSFFRRYGQSLRLSQNQSLEDWWWNSGSTIDSHLIPIKSFHLQLGSFRLVVVVWLLLICLWKPFRHLSWERVGWWPEENQSLCHPPLVRMRRVISCQWSWWFWIMGLEIWPTSLSLWL